MLCYAMPCYATLRHAMLCYAMLSAMLCYAVLCCAMVWRYAYLFVEFGAFFFVGVGLVFKSETRAASTEQWFVRAVAPGTGAQAHCVCACAALGGHRVCFTRVVFVVWCGLFLCIWGIALLFSPYQKEWSSATAMDRFTAKNSTVEFRQPQCYARYSICDVSQR